MTDEFSSYLESTKQSWSQASKTSRTKGKNIETRCPNTKEAFLYRPGAYPVYKDVHRDHDPSQDVDLGQTFMNSEIEFAQSPDQGSSRSMKGSSQCNTRSVKDPWEALRGLARRPVPGKRGYRPPSRYEHRRERAYPTRFYHLARVYASKKYKPVALKVRPVKAKLDEEFRIKRHITGDPLKDLPELPVRPPDFVPTGRYTQERKEIIDKMHNDDFLWPEERKLLHEFMRLQEKGFAWCAEEGGTFKPEFFPPVKIPTMPHKPWVERNIPIPPGSQPAGDQATGGDESPTTDPHPLHIKCGRLRAHQPRRIPRALRLGILSRYG